MKQIYSILFFLSFTFSISFCQTSIDLKKELPNDPKITIGKLKNGLRYYILENKKPENRAELRLAVNAGSVLEDDDQQGLAHFVEHMAFNGTKNFAKQEIVDYLESIGMQFGPDINAYTSFDETVYMLQVPTDSVEAVETAFQILEDWARFKLRMDSCILVCSRSSRNCFLILKVRPAIETSASPSFSMVSCVPAKRCFT